MENRIHISKGNTKLGAIANISLPPVCTCRPDAPCATDGCYALKFYKMYPACRNAWDENLDYYNADADGFFADLEREICTQRYFRWFVSGDMPTADFFERMVALAKALPKTDFLCFTKQFEIVNEYCKANGGRSAVPSNIHLMFSGWEGLEVPNPYNFPSTAVFKDIAEVEDDWKICGGNCPACVCRNTGCWTLKDGETIAFAKH